MLLAGLDFETANSLRGSICQAGIALLEDGVLIRSWECFVRPRPGQCWVSSWNYRVHGIGAEQLRYACEFPQLWPEMAEMLSCADCVVCHNAPFDLSQLRDNLQFYNLPPISFPYMDSVIVSKRLFPELPNHRLDTVANHLHYFFRHHDALEDAAACAYILSQTGLPEDLWRTFRHPAETASQRHSLSHL
ncbi:MAG: hypothetical protein IJJ26_04015 [Victivallales bacterium]|nr:hypothetical protein [Victivallales bacterium]